MLENFYSGKDICLKIARKYKKTMYEIAGSVDSPKKSLAKSKEEASKELFPRLVTKRFLEKAWLHDGVKTGKEEERLAGNLVNCFQDHFPKQFKKWIEDKKEGYPTGKNGNIIDQLVLAQIRKEKRPIPFREVEISNHPKAPQGP